MQGECHDIQQENGMAAHRERVSTSLIEFSILNSMPPRNPNGDDDEEDEDDDEAERDDDEPAVIREPDE